MPGGGAIPALVEAFRKAASGRALISPAMSGIDVLVDAHSSLRRADSLKTLMLLFHSFRKHHNPEENLASFIPLGQLLLADFDLILRAGRKPKEVFAGLHRWEATGASFADFMDEEQKELMRNFSRLFRDNPGESRTRFLRLWENLPAVFEEMEYELLREGSGTPGMVYRDAVNRLLQPGNQKEEFFYFVGFSGLSGLEIHLMRQLAQQGRADFVWDLIPDYALSPVHEVNRIFSGLRRIPEFQASLEDWTKRCASAEKPSIREVVCPGLAGMAQWVLTAELPVEDSTVFIVSDPAMMQLLTGKGKLSNGLNLRFSMGYPLHYTAFSRWLTKVLQWIGRPHPEQCRSFIPLQDDPLFERFFPQAAVKARQAFSALQLPSLAEIRNLANLPDWFFLTNPVGWLRDFSLWMQEVLLNASNDAWLRASLQKGVEICRPLLDMANLAGTEFSFPVLQACMQSAFQTAEIKLVKEEGPEWKAIGLFESLNLDFDRIVILPADEGLFPSGGNSQSLIPDSVRRAFSLPLKQQEAEEQAYQFYRLSHRSKEIIFLTTEGEGSRRSRFLDQMEFGSEFHYSKEIHRFSSAIRLSPEIRILRKPAEMERALAYAAFRKEDKSARKLSPSSMHSLISCPLRFHYQKIAGLQEPEEVSGIQMSAQDFGNWIHTGIQTLLERKAGHRKWIKPEEYDAMEAAWDSVSEEVWMQLEEKNSPGKLAEYPVEIALGQIMAERFFQFMKVHKPHRWLENEYPIPDVKIGKDDAWFTFSGRADIVMEEEDCFRLLDLKTGAFKKSEKLLLQLDDDGLPAEGKMVDNKDYFQMICYNRLASEDPRFKGKPVRSCLFYLAQPEPSLADPFLRVKDRQEEATIYDGLDSILLAHLNRLVDASIPVTQAKDSKVCTFCSFNAMCRR